MALLLIEFILLKSNYQKICTSDGIECEEKVQQEAHLNGHLRVRLNRNLDQDE